MAVALSIFTELGLGSDNPFLLAQLILQGTVALLYSSGVWANYFGQYVQVGLGSAEWRLTDPNMDNVWPRRQKVALATVKRVEVRALAVEFTLYSGKNLRLPLGSLPYSIVQELKRRFEGVGSLLDATGGTLSSRIQTAHPLPTSGLN